MLFKCAFIAIFISLWLACYVSAIGIRWVIDLLLSRRHSFELWTTENWCRASGNLQRWVESHPEECITHEEAQTLLQQELGAYMLWLHAHPSISDDGYLTQLASYIVYEERRPW